MTESTRGELRDLTGLGVVRRREEISNWLNENDEYRLTDVSYAIALMQLGADDDRQTVSGSWSLTAIAAAFWALSISLSSAHWTSYLCGAVSLLALGVSIWAGHRLGQRTDLLVRLYDLRDRYDRRIVRPSWWSRQGQVYLAPKGGRSDEQPSRGARNDDRMPC